MFEKIPDDVLTEKQLKSRLRRRRFYNKHRQEINERRKQLYAANPEKYKERARKYYAGLNPEQKKARVESKKVSREAWCTKNRDVIAKKGRDYYAKNREKCLEYGAKYYEAHAEEMRRALVKSRRKKIDARKMCPAFRFTEYLRLKENARFVVVYRPNTNLAHRASKVCAAIRCADFMLCPVCRLPRMKSERIVASCPMPRVFEFEDAVTQIRKFAKQIIAENKR